MRQGVPYQWGVFAALALLSGRLTVKVPGIKAYFAVSEIFTFSCVLLFGPEAGAVTLALDALVLGWHQRMGAAEDVVQPRRPRAHVVDRRNRLLHMVRRRTTVRPRRTDAGADRPARPPGGELLRHQLRTHRRSDCLRDPEPCVPDLAHPFRLAGAWLRGERIGRAAARRRAATGKVHRGVDASALPGAAALPGLLLHAARLVRAAGRCQGSRRNAESPLPLDRRNAGDGHRRERRSHARPHPPRADRQRSRWRAPSASATT